MNTKPQGSRKSVMDGFKPKNRPNIDNRKRFHAGNMPGKPRLNKKGRVGGCASCK